ncbi:ATP-binding cassette domain-containing protein [Marinovum sp. 2_MG-2023]|uniref:ABC transporter ATP-binding protein n=1 Tax=unclassified Marinovum TaxID=2647166 RepID=UPI0026E3AE73|nr:MULTISPECIES: oligopeptide/dipeptide ABC transporter ATP-binding protein [unclassified Marinovum]MDO6731643.1 ATP-binding cassette domain-containing protein [Marinovum sp. 2_MG-2023]MDO6778231.1 ATP-binding cassette domain-containing protein [Marinovum sp. 1_MG-2023]
MTLLSVENLSIGFHTPDGFVRAVNDVSFDIAAGETVALVGESGSGKSQIALSILGLLASNAKASGKIAYGGQDLLALSQPQLNKIRAKEIAMIFQDPMSSLNPYMTVERQLNESLELHEGLKGDAARKRVLAAMDAVQIPDAKNRLRAYPHEFSGGMRQRIVIAMALLCNPKLILADEPTTALDVTVQAQIMRLLDDIRRDMGTAILLITHDLGVVAGTCENTLVLYSGRVMERADTRGLFAAPGHPYTRGLLRAVPNVHDEDADLVAIPGQPPNQMLALSGCPFAPRCVDVVEACHKGVPELTGGARQRACIRPVEDLT